jgi:GNAT superfamily N-acetyltransferase
MDCLKPYCSDGENVVILRVECLDSSAAGAALRAVAQLCSTYRDELLSCGVPIDSFQQFQAEIDSLPGKYEPTVGGSLILVVAAEGTTRWQPVGCVAVRSVEVDSHVTGTACEIKRLFIVPPLRRSGLGRRLSLYALQVAKDLGYRYVVLDTLRRLTGALELYRSIGFREIPPYNSNPMTDIEYLGMALV